LNKQSKIYLNHLVFVFLIAYSKIVMSEPSYHLRCSRWSP